MENSHSAQVSFLPVNQSRSPPTLKNRRAFLSCERCRRRKTRCEPFEGLQHPCKRCVQEDLPCDFRPERTTRRKRNRAPSAAAHQEREEVSGFGDPNAVSPMAAAPGYCEERASPGQDSFSFGVRTNLLSARLRNPADALDFITVTASDYNGRDGCPSGSNILQSRHTHSAHPDPSHGLPRGLATDSRSCANFCLIRKGIIKPNELFEYLEFFFCRLWPIRPVIPPYYQHPSTHASLVMEEPLLSVGLVAIASRYHPLTGRHGEIRSERVHWRAWKIMQRLLQSAMWGTTFTRSLGTIATMLLLIEWHVKAINNPTEFADDEMVGLGDESKLSFGNPNYDDTTTMEQRDIVAPAYRSNKMSWILLSNAIALAHEGRCFQHELHVSNPSSALGTIKQEWNRLICVSLYFADEHLSTRLGLDPLLPAPSKAVVRDRLAVTFANSLPNNTLWEDYFELTVLTGKAREFIHSIRHAGHINRTPDFLSHLESLNRGLSRWKVQHGYHQHDPQDFLNACVELEYYYTMMYSFAPASYISDSSGNSSETMALSHFMQQATQASYDLLSIVVGILHPTGLLTYLPVRCWLFIVAASLHLLKATISKDKLLSSSHPNARLLQATIDAIQEASPDDTHMSVRYFRFLERLLQSSIITPSQTNEQNAPVMQDDTNHSNDPSSGENNRAEESLFMSNLEFVELGDFPAPFNPYFTDLFSMESMYTDSGR